MNLHFKITTLPSYTKKDGSKSLYLRVTAKGKQKYLSINVSVKPKHWNQRKEEIRLGSPDCVFKNKVIQLSISKAQKIIIDFLHRNQILTINEFERQFNNNSYGLTSFYSFVNDVIKSSSGKDKQTTDFYKFSIGKLKTFRSELSFADITVDFVENYKHYLITDYRNSQTKKPNSMVTAERAVRFIKGMIKEAFRRGVVNDKSICDKIQSKQVINEQEFLTINELKKLENLYGNAKLETGEEKILRGFLFACYTGLRKSDIIDLKYSQLKEIHDEIFIVKKAIKGKKDTILPLSDKAKKLIGEGLPNQKVFQVSINSGYLSKILCELVLKVDIDKKIKFHTSRRTHGSINSMLGINAFTSQKLLNHSSVTTTQLYTKIADQQKIEAIKKWDTF